MLPKLVLPAFKVVASIEFDNNLADFIVFDIVISSGKDNVTMPAFPEVII